MSAANRHHGLSEGQMKKSDMDPKAAQKKLRIASDLFEMAVKIKSHQLRKKLPSASAEEIQARVIELIEKGCR